MKLGIACVYFYPDDNKWILDLQLEYLAQTLRGYNYTIYAGANRLTPDLRDRLETAAHVKVVPLPWYAGAGSCGHAFHTASYEHAFYLDRLLNTAVDDGCNYVAAIDADSFPIIPDWPHRLLAQMGDSVRLAAVLCAEDKDTHLPHPCGYFMRSSFLVERQPKLLASDDELASAPFREFLEVTGQRADTGIGYGYVLWRNRETWLQLLRSNRVSLHYLMAGIYGGVFFHLGAGSRTPVFVGDYPERWVRAAGLMRNLPLLRRIAPALHDRYVRDNSRIFESISRRLKDDPRRFIEDLAGDNSSSARLPCTIISSPDWTGSNHGTRVGRERSIAVRRRSRR